MGVLEGKVAIVTGAGQGVGRGIALALAAEGASVVIAGRTMDKCVDAAEEITGRGGSALPIACDVKVAADVESCVTAAIERFGRLDIMVNNAQEVPRGRILDVSDDAYRAGWESGPLATLRFMRACHPHLAGRNGVIINLASRSGIKPNAAGAGVYAAIKEDTRTLTRAAAVEWAADGIRVYALLPLSNSPALERLEHDEPAVYERVLSEIPMRRFGDPEADIGRVAVFLCSDDAGYLTGISITADGGAGHIG
ncbi:MAG: 3-oxoacyl-ACP reductase [Acidimicrobiales bacterium]|nr:3-oxoacyl-ACP reductase [Acidimicrobiales bacterium]